MTCARGRRLSINDPTAATAGWHRSATSTQEETMSFQAYLDNIEDKTGLTPREFINLAHERGFDDPSTKAGTIVEWLKEDYGLGHGHAMALVRTRARRRATSTRTAPIGVRSIISPSSGTARPSTL
jgi:hypothetical protein